MDIKKKGQFFKVGTDAISFFPEYLASFITIYRQIKKGSRAKTLSNKFCV